MQQWRAVHETRFPCGQSSCREFPGELDRIRVWFRDYKTPDGKPENKFGYDDQWQNKEFTLQARKPSPPPTPWQCQCPHVVMTCAMGCCPYF